MAFYTIPKEKIYKKIYKEYRIKKKDIKGIKKGSENSNFFLNKKYILTIIESKKTCIFSNINILDIIKNIILCPKILIRKNGKKFFKYKKKYSLITVKLKGKSIKNPNKINCFRLGVVLSKIHNYKKFYYLLKNNKFCVKRIISDYKKYKKIFKEKNFFIKNIKNNFIKLPFGINHCDLFKDNVFYEKKKISGILDFYFSGLDFYIFDLSIIIIDWCIIKNKFSYKNLKYFFCSYNFYRKINKKEIINIVEYIKIISFRFFVSRNINNEKNKKFKDPVFFKKIFLFFKKNKKKIIKKIEKYLSDKKFYN